MPAAALWQLQTARSLRIGKIIDIAPVRRRWLSRRLATQEVLDQAVPAAPAGAQCIDIVALAPHPDGKLHRLDRPLLSDQPGCFCEFAAQGERQLRGIAAPVQEANGERFSERGCPGSVSSGAEIGLEKLRV